MGRAAISGLSPDLLMTLRNEQTKLDLDLGLIRDDSFDFAKSHLLNWDDLHLSEVKIILSSTEFPSEESKSSELYFTDSWQSRDIGALKAVTYQIADLSQYARIFGRSVALELYERWVDNCLSGAIADQVFLVKSKQNDQPLAFVAVKMDDRASAEVMLIAVDGDSRGAGIGHFLITNTLYRLGHSGINSCLVSTQLTNRSALRFYNSMHFRFDSYRVDFMLNRSNGTSSFNNI